MFSYVSQLVETDTTIAVCFQEGKIAQAGSYTKLMANGGGTLATLVTKHEGEQQDTSTADGEPSDHGAAAMPPAGHPAVDTAAAAAVDVVAHGDKLRSESAAGARLVEEEERKEGRVALSVLGRYLRAGSTTLPLVSHRLCCFHCLRGKDTSFPFRG